MKRKFPITNIRKVWYTCIARLSFFTKNSGIYYSIRQSKFSEIQTGIFGRMESAPNLRASQLNSLFTSRLSVERLVSHLICCWQKKKKHFSKKQKGFVAGTNDILPKEPRPLYPAFILLALNQKISWSLHSWDMSCYLVLFLLVGCIRQSDSTRRTFLSVERIYTVLFPSWTTHCSHLHLPWTISKAGKKPLWRLFHSVKTLNLVWWLVSLMTFWNFLIVIKNLIVVSGWLGFTTCTKKVVFKIGPSDIFVQKRIGHEMQKIGQH